MKNAKECKNQVVGQSWQSGSGEGSSNERRANNGAASE
jgi:hypothetical protein